MPIILAREDGCTFPVFCCDFCGDRIEDAKDGSYIWNPSNIAIHPAFCHKACDSRAHRERFPYSWELQDFCQFLQNNTENAAMTKDRASMLSEVGCL